MTRRKGVKFSGYPWVESSERHRLTVVCVPWVRAVGSLCEMHRDLLITANVIEVFWVVSWAEVNEITKSFIDTADCFI